MSHDLHQTTPAEMAREIESLQRDIAQREHDLRTYREEFALQTEQLLATQTQLEVSRDRYADLYDFAPLPYVTLTANGLVDDLNLTGASLLECDRKTVLGLPFTQFVAAEDRRAFLDHLHYCRQGCSPWSTELQVQSRSGRMLPVQLVSARASDPHTNDLQFRTVLVDLAGRKAAEAEVRLLNADLEARVGSRTAELEQANAALELEVQERRAAEQALRASEERDRGLADALQEAGRRKDEFLAMLGHELRNPLAACAGAVALLQFEDTASPGIIQARQIIARQLDTMTRLIDDLLDVSRVARGKISLRPRPVDLAEIVRRAASVMETLLHARQHRLSITVPESPVIVEVDATRIEQVLVNLLNNAAKYTPCGGQIELKLEQDEAGARLTVRDNGDGLTPDLVEHAFDIFVQGARSADRTQGGLGIGLTMAKSVIELHRGTIAASSAGPGQGSQFVVTLPAPSAPPATALASEPGFTDAPPCGLLNRQVLVVEDNRDVAKTLALLLERLGLTCHVVHDGPAALAAIETLRPDVVLMDIGLPGMDGYEVVRRVRQQAHLHQPLLIALTGYGLPENRRQGEQAGFDHYLTKPVMPSTLYALVREQHTAAG